MSSTCCEVQEKKFHQTPLFKILIITTIIITAAYFIDFLNPVYHAFMDYMKVVWWAVLLGLLIGGLIDYFVPHDLVTNLLGKNEAKSIFMAVGLGFLLSSCSHGILAIAIQLYKKGASTAAVIALLLASPWANLPITILLFGFFGKKALFMILSAIFIALTTGFIFLFLEKKGWVEEHKYKGKIKHEKHNIKKDAKSIIIGVSKGAWNLAKMIMWWMFIGMLMASFARAFVPQEFFIKYMGASLLGMVVTLVLATVIEVCSEGSAPMAFEIFNQTGAFGNAMTFLMAGVATDYTEIGLIWTNIGKKAAIWIPIITVPQILVLGYLFNVFL